MTEQHTETEHSDAETTTKTDATENSDWLVPAMSTRACSTENNLAINLYMALNNSICRLILTQGDNGELLLKMLDYVETLGPRKFTAAHLATNLLRQCNKAGEFDRAIKSALLNWTAGVAHGLVKYGTEGGLDGWRKFYNKYMPLANDMQHILIRELVTSSLWVRPTYISYSTT